jgi:transcriptional regulator with XRE-family HTH domain
MDYLSENVEKFDFMEIGDEIKAERERRGWTRDKAAAMLDISESYLKAIENNGAVPGFQLFYRIMTLFSISVDKHFFPDAPVKTRGRDRALYQKANNLLRERETNELYVLISTMDGMEQVKKTERLKAGAGEGNNTER